jgi:hypothetical protein
MDREVVAVDPQLAGGARFLGISGVAASTTDSGRLMLTRLSSLPSCTLMCSQRFVFASAAAAPIKSRAIPITLFHVIAVSLAPALRRCY